jgi:hypothetical protein
MGTTIAECISNATTYLTPDYEKNVHLQLSLIDNSNKLVLTWIVCMPTNCLNTELICQTGK